MEPDSKKKLKVLTKYVKQLQAEMTQLRQQLAQKLTQEAQKENTPANAKRGDDQLSASQLRALYNIQNTMVMGDVVSPGEPESTLSPDVTSSIGTNVVVPPLESVVLVHASLPPPPPSVVPNPSIPDVLVAPPRMAHPIDNDDGTFSIPSSLTTDSVYSPSPSSVSLRVEEETQLLEHYRMTLEKEKEELVQQLQLLKDTHEQDEWRLRVIQYDRQQLVEEMKKLRQDKEEEKEKLIDLIVHPSLDTDDNRRIQAPLWMDDTDGTTERYDTFEILAQRDEYFRSLSVAVVGTTNSGKSTLINALLHADLLPRSDTPETRFLTVLRNAAVEEPVLRVVCVSDENQPESTVASTVESAGDPLDEIVVGVSNVRSRLKELTHNLREHERLGRCDSYVADIQSRFPLAHQSDWDVESSRFAFLDTPGVNEARIHSFVQDSYKETLQNSDLIVVVIEYGTNGTADLEKCLKRILVHNPDLQMGQTDFNRVVVVVNKIDHCSDEHMRRVVVEQIRQAVQSLRLSTTTLQVSAEKALLGRLLLVQASDQQTMSKRISEENLNRFLRYSFGDSASKFNSKSIQERLDIAMPEVESMVESSGINEVESVLKVLLRKALHAKNEYRRTTQKLVHVMMELLRREDLFTNTNEIPRTGSGRIDVSRVHRWPIKLRATMEGKKRKLHAVGLAVGGTLLLACGGLIVAPLFGQVAVTGITLGIRGMSGVLAVVGGSAVTTSAAFIASGANHNGMKIVPIDVGTVVNSLPPSPDLSRLAEGIRYKDVICYPSGELLYVGDFIGLKFDGVGTLFHRNGRVLYTGPFSNGFPHGRGQLFRGDLVNTPLCDFEADSGRISRIVRVYGFGKPSESRIIEEVEETVYEVEKRFPVWRDFVRVSWADKDSNRHPMLRMPLAEAVQLKEPELALPEGVADLYEWQWKGEWYVLGWDDRHPEGWEYFDVFRHAWHKSCRVLDHTRRRQWGRRRVKVISETFTDPDVDLDLEPTPRVESVQHESGAT